MKAKYKFIIIFFTLIFLTGCKAEYNIKINMDGKIEEEMTLTERKELIIDDFTKEKYEKYIDEVLKIDNLKKELIFYSTFSNEDTAGLKLKNKYKSIYEYTKESKAISYIFKKIKVTRNKNVIKINSIKSDYDTVVEESTGKLYYNDSVISISLPYKVESSNAHEINESTNTYSWFIDENFDGIELEYNVKKLYSINLFKLFKYATINTCFYIFIAILALILVLTIIVLGIKLIIKERKD